MKIVHEWLQDYVGDTIPDPDKIAELLTFHAFEIEEVTTVAQQTVIDVDVLPNRSSDCLCHRGIAREIATLTNSRLTHDPLTVPVELPHTDKLAVVIEDATRCPRFTASLITGVTVGPSPAWLQARLAALGQRSINNIVDATNYVMYAIGQPLHAYDADLFTQQSGVWQFGVRIARPNETISLIAEGSKDEDRIITLTGSELLIVDRSTDTPIGLAGVKGGRYAGVHEGTKNIIIEAAHFEPSSTRQTARRLGIVIDASKRFENEPSRELPLYAQRDIIELITDIAGGVSEGIIDVYVEKKIPPTVLVRVSHTCAVLGLTLSKADVITLLTRAGITVNADDDADVLMCTGPFERTDLLIEEDFIEEVGRIYGFVHVPAVVPDTVPLVEINARQYYAEQVSNILVTQGFSEVITSSFRKKDQVELQNALASDKRFLRSSLIKNISDVLDKNATIMDVLGVDDIRVFEIGTVFSKGKSTVDEHVALTFGVRIKPSGYSGKEDALLLDIIASLEQVFDRVPVTIERGVAEINFSKVITSLPAPTQYNQVSKAAAVVYKPFSIYPAMSRDIAIWVGADTTAADVASVLNETAGPLRLCTRLFDEFNKDGKTSYAFRLVFQSNEKTLTDSDVNLIMDQINIAVAGHAWEVR